MLTEHTAMRTCTTLCTMLSANFKQLSFLMTPHAASMHRHGGVFDELFAMLHFLSNVPPPEEQAMTITNDLTTNTRRTHRLRLFRLNGTLGASIACQHAISFDFTSSWAYWYSSPRAGVKT